MPDATASWAATLLESHVREKLEGGALRLRVDQVVVGAEVADIVLESLSRSGLGRIVVESALIDGDRRAVSMGLERADAVTRQQERAARLGFEFLRPGGGWAARAHLERSAAPGRIAAVTGVWPSLAGALGGLALECDALEILGVLGTGELETPAPSIRGVRVRGRLPRGIDGADLAFALRERTSDLETDVLAFEGEGARSIALADRLRAIQALDGAGPRSVLFPPDEAARDALRAFGREPDWRGSAERAPEPGELEIDLESLEPRIAGPDGRARVQRVRERRGDPVARVLLGPHASLEDVGAFLDAFAEAGTRAASGVTWIPGSLSARRRAADLGWIDRLQAIGVRIAEPGETAGAPDDSQGLTLAWGASNAPGAVVLVAGPLTCAASARAGAIEPTGAEHATSAPVVVVTNGWVQSRDDEPSPPESAPPPAESSGSRTEVLIALGDDVTTEDILPWGARRERIAGDAGALSEHLFEGVDRAFVERARERRSGAVVAGSRFGRSSRSGVEAALALASAGVRVVLAGSFDARFRRQLADAGILPLRIRRNDARLGDELELPGVPRDLAPERPVAVRNLTRGSETLADHDLEPHVLDRARDGGWIARLARAGRGAA